MAVGQVGPTANGAGFAAAGLTIASTGQVVDASKQARKIALKVCRVRGGVWAGFHALILVAANSYQGTGREEVE